METKQWVSYFCIPLAFQEIKQVLVYGFGKVLSDLLPEGLIT